MLLMVFWTTSVWAQDIGETSTSASYEAPGEPSSLGLATLFGPQVGLNGPPTAFKLTTQLTHQLRPSLGFYAGLGFIFTGQATIEGDAGLPDSNYDATLGVEFSTGAQWFMDLGWAPVEPYLRAGAAFELLSAGDVVGYHIGPLGAFGVRYAMLDSFYVMGEVETTLGFGQLRGNEQLLAWTMDVLVGVQWLF